MGILNILWALETPYCICQQYDRIGTSITSQNKNPPNPIASSEMARTRC